MNGQTNKEGAFNIDIRNINIGPKAHSIKLYGNIYSIYMIVWFSYYFLLIITIKSPFVMFLSFHHIFLRANNSAMGGDRVLPKVANERYCNVVLIK